ncbi:carbohydrate kinase [Pedobacter sp. SYSU D00535]|uniref:carbohydrate kinase family protein n=1 Tax=Pedobacter sp. SYSU D00535 TaxID=2810308 RepID=UPI001A959113|nr:carbohydrate kinase [Pedobacter sp. SYSU D00535]
MHQVICFGEVLWDKLPSGKKVGGAPLNVALHLSRQGVDSRLISSIGRDEEGQELKHFLKQYKLDFSLVQEHFDLPTGIVDVELDEYMQASYIIVEPVAWDEIYFNEALSRITQAADAMVYGSLAARNEISRKTLMQLLALAKFKVFDMNLRPPHFSSVILEELMQHCNLLKINEHELDYLKNLYHLRGSDTKTLLTELSIAINTPTICVTLGAEGAAAYHEGEYFSHKGFKVTVADTVGAGDAFLASFVKGWLDELPVGTILTQACGAGALVASKTGATPDYTLSDIAAIIG